MFHATAMPLITDDQQCHADTHDAPEGMVISVMWHEGAIAPIVNTRKYVLVWTLSDQELWYVINNRELTEQVCAYRELVSRLGEQGAQRFLSREPECYLYTPVHMPRLIVSNENLGYFAEDTREMISMAAQSTQALWSIALGDPIDRKGVLTLYYKNSLPMRTAARDELTRR